MKRVRVALDANLPQRLVSLLRAAFQDQGFEFMWEPDFAPANAQDEHWLDAFARFGGEVVLSADKNIARRPHQLIAVQQAGLKGYFFDNRWAQHDGPYKAAHLMLWWPRIATHARFSKPGDCVWVPAPLHAKEFRVIRSPRPQAIRVRRPRRKKSD